MAAVPWCQRWILTLVFPESQPASGHLWLGPPESREQKASAFKGDLAHGALLVGFLWDPFRIPALLTPA